MKAMIVLVSISLVSSLWAATKSEQQESVRSMLKQIEQAQEAHRYEKVNAFKKQIQTMNLEVQEEANNKLIKLQERLRINEGTGQGEQVQNRNEVRNKEREKLQLQEQEMLQMQRQEQMKSQKKIKKVPTVPSRTPGI